MVGPRGFEPPTYWSQTSRATKLRHGPNIRQVGGLQRSPSNSARNRRFTSFAPFHVGAPRCTSKREKRENAESRPVALRGVRANARSSSLLRWGCCQERNRPVPRGGGGGDTCAGRSWAQRRSAGSHCSRARMPGPSRSTLAARLAADGGRSERRPGLHRPPVGRVLRLLPARRVFAGRSHLFPTMNDLTPTSAPDALTSHEAKA